MYHSSMVAFETQKMKETRVFKLTSYCCERLQSLQPCSWSEFLGVAAPAHLI